MPDRTRPPKRPSAVTACAVAPSYAASALAFVSSFLPITSLASTASIITTMVCPFPSTAADALAATALATLTTLPSIVASATHAAAPANSATYGTRDMSVVNERHSLDQPWLQLQRRPARVQCNR